ncbi:hypothetical protein ABZ705_00970 [Streptomyces sp. NPDC006984]|uniref:hypothetical protein n=1 Tax=Streptomyces sp. NPDC006984 TaxID=3155463 RepID=UPI0033E4281F
MTPLDGGEFTALWAQARAAYFGGDHPPYASRAWRALPPDDPRRLAAAMEAAEKWRKYGDEDALLQWFRDVSDRARYALDRSRAHAELVEARKPRPAWQLKATPGWPPVAIPGRPGWWRHHLDGRQVDLPHNRPRLTHQQQEAA